MKKRKSGFYWHVHHNIAIEWCYDYDERLESIKSHKPKEEQEVRIKLLQPVLGKLPSKLTKAGLAYDKARLAYIEARDAYDEARDAYIKTSAAYNKARDAFIKAKHAYINEMMNCRKAIEILHAKECPNCPWNGKTIFP